MVKSRLHFPLPPACLQAIYRHSPHIATVTKTTWEVNRHLVVYSVCGVLVDLLIWGKQAFRIRWPVPPSTSVLGCTNSTTPKFSHTFSTFQLTIFLHADGRQFGCKSLRRQPLLPPGLPAFFGRITSVFYWLIELHFGLPPPLAHSPSKSLRGNSPILLVPSL